MDCDREKPSLLLLPQSTLIVSLCEVMSTEQGKWFTGFLCSFHGVGTTEDFVLRDITGQGLVLV